MHTKKSRCLFLFLLCFIPAAALAQRYTVTDLGPLTPSGINSWAQVVGNYNVHGYVWSKFGGTRDLGLLTDGTFSRAAAINDLGTITGTADGAGTVFSTFPDGTNVSCGDGLVQPFVWTARDGMKGLGITYVVGMKFDDPCIARFYATSLNVKGQVVGFTQELPDYYQWAYTWSPTKTMTFLGGSWIPTYALGISNLGQIVGESTTYNYDVHATTWKNGVATDLNPSSADGSLPYNSSANGVNDVGQVVGWVTTKPVFPEDCYYYSLDACPIHASVWAANGSMTDLGTLPGDTVSAASKINLFGLVVGSSGNAAAHEQDFFREGPLKVVGRPFIWSQRSGMRDLNTLIPQNSGWLLQSGLTSTCGDKL